MRSQTEIEEKLHLVNAEIHLGDRKEPTNKSQSSHGIAIHTSMGSRRRTEK